MRHTISVLVENKFGVLTRVAGLFSGRGYNIDTLNVAPTADPTASRMTIVTRGDDATLEQIVKQLNKLTDIMKVQDFREGEYVDRELVLVKVAVDSATRAADHRYFPRQNRGCAVQEPDHRGHRRREQGGQVPQLDEGLRRDGLDANRESGAATEMI